MAGTLGLVSIAVSCATCVSLILLTEDSSAVECIGTFVATVKFCLQFCRDELRGGCGGTVFIGSAFLGMGVSNVYLHATVRCPFSDRARIHSRQKAAFPMIYLKKTSTLGQHRMNDKWRSLGHYFPCGCLCVRGFVTVNDLWECSRFTR